MFSAQLKPDIHSDTTMKKGLIKKFSLSNGFTGKQLSLVCDKHGFYTRKNHYRPITRRPGNNGREHMFITGNEFVHKHAALCCLMVYMYTRVIVAYPGPLYQNGLLFSLDNICTWSIFLCVSFITQCSKRSPK